MSRVDEINKLLKEAGEMSKSDIEKGGDWYEFRLELEDICKKAGLKCEVKPFDQYQGPYAFISQAEGSLWGVGDDEFYFEPSRGSKNKEFTGSKDQMIKFLKKAK